KLVSEPRPDCIALVLRIGEMARPLSERIARIVAEKEPPGNREPDVAHHVRVANIAGELLQSNQIELPFRTVDDRLVKCDGIADAGVEKLVVIRIIPHIAAIKI